jgi:hypothetical protein
MAGMMPHPMPHCTPVTGPVVWYVASTKSYFFKGSALYGKGRGTYLCRATAVARGGHPVNLNRGETRPQHHTTGGSPMPMTMTMAPRPMTTPNPASSGNPMSGNQGNTGAPGAGGQVPNNPASSSNNNPSPSPSPHP